MRPPDAPPPADGGDGRTVKSAWRRDDDTDGTPINPIVVEMADTAVANGNGSHLALDTLTCDCLSCRDLIRTAPTNFLLGISDIGLLETGDDPAPADFKLVQVPSEREVLFWWCAEAQRPIDFDE